MTQLLPLFFVNQKIFLVNVCTRKFSTRPALLTESEDNDSSDSTDNSQEKVEYRKTYYSDLRKQTVKFFFDTKKTFTVPDNLSEQDESLRERVDLSDEKRELMSDFSNIMKGKTAVAKINHNVTPKHNEFKAFSLIKNKYREFFDEDVDSSQPLQELDDVKDYISGELKNNVLRHKKLKNITSQSRITVINKRKADDVVNSDEESTSSKKSRQSPSDYIDNLPVDHNPLDDIGD
jgi:hypothetical protein